MDFSIFPTFRKVGDLVEAIKEKDGVSVREFDEAIDLDKPGPDYTIILLNFDQLLHNPKYSRVLLPNDAYDVEFITDYLANPKTDLRNYKITPSNYNIQEHDVNDVLHKRKSWNTLIRLKSPKARVSNKMMLKLYYAVKSHDYDSFSSLDNDDEQSGNSQNGNLQNGQVRDQEQDDDGGGKRKEKDLPISSPGRRSSPRKKKMDNGDDGQKDQPVAGHSRHLMRAAHTENHEKKDDDINVQVQSSPKHRQRSSANSPRVTAAPAAEIDDSDAIKTVSPPISPPRQKKKAAASRQHSQRAAAPDSEDDDGVEVVATPDSQNVRRNSSGGVVPAAAAAGRAPAPAAADSDIELEDSDESHVEVQSSPERRPGSSNSSSGSGNGDGQVRGRRVSAGQDLGGRRHGAILRGYSHADSQNMLNLIVRNDWGRYVKGNTLWKFVVQHKFLEHTVGVRSHQSLMGQFKKHIGPKVERMTTGGTDPFVISSQDLKKYKKARAEASAQPHANFFQASRYRVEDVVRV